MLYDCLGRESAIATCQEHLAGMVLELRYRRIVMVIGLCWFGNRMSSWKGGKNPMSVGQGRLRPVCVEVAKYERK